MQFEEFYSLANRLGVHVEKSVFDKLSVYFKFLTEYNGKINLTSITKEEDVFLLHFLDSLSGAPLVEDEKSVCDIGTGAGFPGVVLKLVKPSIKLTLIDSLQKRITFLCELKDKLGIQYDCVHMRAEDAGKNPAHREKYDVVVSRAVAKLNTLYEYALPLVKIDGKFIAYKASCEEELRGSENVPKMLGGKFYSCKKFILPKADAERSLIEIKKERATEKHYPRGKNKERDVPLQ